LQVAEWKEEWEILLAKMTKRQHSLLEVCHLDMSNGDVARLLGVSEGRVSQVRREIERLARE
jgi:DNA-directed RNA polymerase specialized sigma subunit